MTQMGRSSDPPGAGGVFAFIAVSVAVGFPLVFVIWETINQLLTGNVAGVRWGWFTAAIIGFGVLLVVLARLLSRWSATR